MCSQQRWQALMPPHRLPRQLFRPPTVKSREFAKAISDIPEDLPIWRFKPRPRAYERDFVPITGHAKSGALPEPVAPTGPANFRVCFLRISRDVSRFFRRPTVGTPLGTRHQAKPTRKRAGLPEGPISIVGYVGGNRASREPIAPTGPAISGINMVWRNRNIVGLCARFCVRTPFVDRFQSEPAREGTSILERSISALASV